MNFEKDIKDEILSLARKSGLNISANNSVKVILLDYLTVRQKVIEPKSRKISISQKLLDEIENHPKRKEITTIIDIATKGENLNIFQSKKLLQTRFFDHLQNEWNIYHFHLSLEKEKKSIFVKQVNALLFAYVDDEKIAFLGTDIHKKGIFGDIKWIEILHDWFPEIIEPFLDKKLSSFHPKLTASERQQVWSKGYTLGWTEIKGKVYQNPGIGRTISGHSFTITREADEIMRWAFRLREQIKECKDELSELLNLEVNSDTFGIHVGEKGLELIEKKSKEKILDFPMHFITKEKMKEKITTRNNV